MISWWCHRGIERNRNQDFAFKDGRAPAERVAGAVNTDRHYDKSNDHRRGRVATPWYVRASIRDAGCALYALPTLLWTTRLTSVTRPLNPRYRCAIRIDRLSLFNWMIERSEPVPDLMILPGFDCRTRWQERHGLDAAAKRGKHFYICRIYK